jgi:hypothetical protein
MTIKKIGIKIEIQNKFCFWWRVKLKKNINWIKGHKKNNEIQNSNKNKNNFLIEGWNWKEKSIQQNT